MLVDIYEGGHIALKGALTTLSYILLSIAFCLFCSGICGFRIAYGRFSFESVITVELVILIPSILLYNIILVTQIIQEKILQFSVSSRLAWFLFGIAVFPSALLAFYGTSVDHNSANFLIITLILVHYTYRTFIYAYGIKGGKRIPLHLFALGFCNNFFQGFLQSTWHFMFAFYPVDWFTRLNSVVGLSLFIFGMFIHIKSDGILRKLRRRHDRGYKVPRGFLFESITAPNYLGECLEWIGFATFAWSLPAFAHACFVICLLLPRALQYHRWYLKKFSDYPKDRKAIVPLLL